MTQINETINSTPPTKINMTVAEELSYAGTAILKSGLVVCGKYIIEHRLDVASGEADLYLCSSNGRQYVAKIYKRKIAIKDEVVEALLKIDSPYIAKLYETSTFDGLPIEITPYYKNGSLQGKTFSYDELHEMIIPCINEGLSALHRSGVIHKDLKPSNIMLADDAKSVAIIDFGISSVKSEGNTVLVTETGMSPEYSAPETFRALYLEESDYYSFGITLYELFCGKTPYKNMSADAIEKYLYLQRIPFPENIPDKLEDLITALTYYDIANRNNKANPNRRWSYDEVIKWREGKTQVIPGKGTNYGEPQMPPYDFLGKSYATVPDLVNALAVNWNDGKQQFFHGHLFNYFKSFNVELAGLCMDLEYESGKGAYDDFTFWKLLYKLYPEMRTFYWQGQVYQGLPALGRNIIERLNLNIIDTSEMAFYDSIFKGKLLSAYVSMTDPENEAIKSSADSLESVWTLCRGNRDRIRHLYIAGYTLSGHKIFHIDGQDFHTVGELSEYVKSLLDKSYEAFESFCHRMIDYDDNLDAQFETWLIALGKRKELDLWRENLRA